MKLIAGCLLTVLLAIACKPAFAQSPVSSIRGKVEEENSAPADAATIVLLNAADSSVIKSTITNPGGIFSFSDISNGSYLLFITKLNYTGIYSSPYTVAGKDVDAGDVILKIAAKQLNEIAVTGKKDFVEIRPDKTVLNVEQNIIASGGSVYDVLRSAPGVKIINNEVLLQGGQKALIAINGKPVLLTGEELLNLLKNYQSSDISQVELIANPSAKFDAASSGGMVNIILKENRSFGSNVSVTGSAAYGNKYRSNVGINWNLKTEKWNVFASYNFADNKTIHAFTNERVINIDNQVNNFDVDYSATTLSKNSNFNFGTDFSIAPKQTVGVLFNGSDNSIDIDKHNITDIGSNGQVDSIINTQSAINRHIVNLNYNANYKGSFGSEGKSTLSADMNYTTYNRHSTELLQNDFFDPAGQPNGTPLLYSDNSPSGINIRSENIDFSQVLSKSSQLDIGIKNSQVNSDNTIDFNQVLNGSEIPVADLTDHFVYKERINAAYVSFASKFADGSVSLGLRAEQTNSSSLSANPNRETDSSYFNLFPKALITYAPNKDNELSASYAYSINRPNYQDLNPFIGYVDQFFYNTGNPFLKPSYVNTFQVSDLYFQKYKLTLSANITHNYFSTIFQQDDVTKVYTTMKDNIATRYRYGAQFDLPFTLANWWNINADFSFLHDQFDYYAAGAINKGSFALEGIMTQSFTISRKLSAQLEGIYQSPTYFVISQYKADYYFNAGIRYSVLNNKGSISLSARDIFNTDVDKIYSNYLNLDITQRDKYATRFFGITFNYRFGTSSIKAHSNTTEEQKRLGSSSNEN